MGWWGLAGAWWGQWQQTSRAGQWGCDVRTELRERLARPIRKGRGWRGRCLLSCGWQTDPQELCAQGGDQGPKRGHSLESLGEKYPHSG